MALIWIVLLEDSDGLVHLFIVELRVVIVTRYRQAILVKFSENMAKQRNFSLLQKNFLST